MSRFHRSRAAKIGLPQGSLIHVGDLPDQQLKIDLLVYDEAGTAYTQNITPTELAALVNVPEKNIWIDIRGVHEGETLSELGKILNLHPLTLEDIMNTDHRPKLEEFNLYFFLVLKHLSLAPIPTHTTIPVNDVIQAMHVSFILSPNRLITFRESNGDIFQAVRERLLSGKSKLSQKKVDYLLYSLMDVVIDQYFVVLENLSDRLELMEEALMQKPSGHLLQVIYAMKREMIFLRKNIWPVRELINKLEHSESELFQEATHLYLRDLYDHTIQIIDTIESFRDLTSGMVDVYLSNLSYQTNAVMRILTVISTIFIPITFIASIYGMNFDHMPELHWPHAYPITLGLMALLALLMLIYFQRKQWL